MGFIPQKKFTPKKVKICEKSGKLKYKPEEDVAPGYKIACNGKHRVLNLLTYLE